MLLREGDTVGGTANLTLWVSRWEGSPEVLVPGSCLDRKLLFRFQCSEVKAECGGEIPRVEMEGPER